jgi:hypothetical protein
MGIARFPDRFSVSSDFFAIRQSKLAEAFRSYSETWFPYAFKAIQKGRVPGWDSPLLLDMY